METVADRPLALARAETLLAAAIAAAAAVAVVVLAPPGGDVAAHLWRTELVRDGILGWDTSWYGGQYPFASYSLLYYLPAALVGNVALVTACAVAGAALFAAVAHDEWGEAATWPARAFAVAAAIPLYTGTYSYAAGFAAALGALRLAQRRRPWGAALVAVVTLGLSPLAFAFLGLALAAAALARRRVDRPVLVVAGGLAAAVALQELALALFPSEGRYPYSLLSLAAVLAVTALAAPLALRAPAGRALGAFLLLWAGANVVAALVDSPFGDNLARLRYVVAPLVLLAVVLARGRPRVLAVPALAVAFLYNVGPDLSALNKRLGDRATAEAAFWQPAVDYVRAHGAPGERVEVVPTFGHWEAWFLPRAGVPVARGWYRQLDIARNPELYRPFTPAVYRAWLRRNGVRLVLVPDARLGPLGASREAALLESGRSGLRRAARLPGWRVWELPSATPLLTGPGRPRVTSLAPDRVTAVLPAVGTYLLRIRWTPLWRAAGAGACVEETAGGWTAIRAERPGGLALDVPRDLRGLGAAATGSPSRCR